MMEIDEARELRRWAAVAAGSRAEDESLRAAFTRARAEVRDEEERGAELAAESETLRTRLSQIETRAQQIRGGLKPYARPVEIVDYLMGEQP